MSRVQLSRSFFLDEFTRSQTATRYGIAVEIPLGSDLHRNVLRLVNDVLQPVRDWLGPVHITSGYRPRILNSFIGGSDASQHLSALAADFVVSGRAPLEVCGWIREHLPFAFDQLIHEFGRWVHVSVAAEGATPRNETLTAYRNKEDKTVYAPGLHSIESLQEAV